MHLDYSSSLAILDKSTVLYSEAEISQCIDKIATQIESDIKSDIPIFLSVMNGAMFFTTELLKRINSPLLLNYIHASRYGEATFGSSHVTWYRQPNTDEIRGKNVYILDDILDEGHTLAEIVRYINSIGVNSCKVAVLVDKEIGKPKSIAANYVGLQAPNKFLFGCGMDIYGLYRQLPDIHVYNS